VVVVVDVSVLVQPTSAITQTPKTSGMSFFMSALLPETPPPFDSYFPPAQTAPPEGESSAPPSTTPGVAFTTDALQTISAPE
jgi:hypothetical protein